MFNLFPRLDIPAQNSTHDFPNELLKTVGIGFPSIWLTPYQICPGLDTYDHAHLEAALQLLLLLRKGLLRWVT